MGSGRTLMNDLHRLFIECWKHFVHDQIRCNWTSVPSAPERLASRVEQGWLFNGMVIFKVEKRRHIERCEIPK